MAKNKEAKIKFTAETGEFNEQIKKSDSSLRELRSELQLNASQMKKTGDNTKTLQERQAILHRELDASRQKTEALAAKLEKAKNIFGENSEEAKRLQTQLNNARTAEQKIADEIEDTNAKLEKQKKSLQDVADKAEAVGDKLVEVGKGMSVVSAGIVAAGAATVAAFNEVDEGADNVIKATGATGKAASDLEDTYTNVTRQIVGDFADIGAAVGEINTRFGYTGQKLEQASLRFEKFASITGMDAKDAVQAVSRALNDAGIPLDQYDSLLDQLAKAGQAAGIDVATLADSLSKNGAVMRGMGFDTEETIALLAQFELSGADASTMLTGMKRAMATWAEEGKNGNKEFAKTVEGIKNGSITASEALDIFGTRAGPMLVDAIKSGKFEYKDMLKTIQSSKGTVESTFKGTVDGGYEMELAMQNAKVAAAEVGETLATTLVPFVQKGTKALQGFASWWSGLSERTQKTIFVIAGVVASIGPLLVVLGTVAGSISKITTLISTIKGVVTAFTAVKTAATAATVANTAAEGANAVAKGAEATTTATATAAQTALNVATYAFPGTWIVAAIVAVIAIVVALVAAIVALVKNWDKVKAAGVNAWNSIKRAWSGAGAWFRGVWKSIRSAFANAVDWFKRTFTRGKEAAVNAWDKSREGFSKSWNRIQDTFGNVKSWFRSKFKGARDAVMDVWSKFKLEMPDIKLPHFKIKGEFSLVKRTVPHLSVDWYAKGGIFTKPTIFSTPYGLKGVGDVRGGEAVLPLERLQGFVSDAVERSMPVQDLTPLVRAVEDLAKRPIDMQINGRSFAQATVVDTDSVNGLRTKLLERGLVLE